MTKLINLTSILLLTSALLLTGCSLYKPYDQRHDVPAGLMGDIPTADDSTSLGTLRWQELFTDPLLQQLVERAFQNNTDLQQAQLTIQQAQNDLCAARMGNLPILSFEPAGSLTRFNSLTTRTYDLPLTATWQVNIFGQATTRRRQAKAYLEQQADYRQAVQTQLAANVANTYYQLIMLDRQLQILLETQTVWEQSLETMRTLYEAGLYQSPAVHQMQGSLSTVLAGIAEIQALRQTTESTLCLLLSEPPHTIARSTFDSFTMPARLSVGLPLRLLDARPDVRQAARGIEIAYYDTQQARQALYPNITLSANLGWSNGDGLVNPARFLSQAIASLTQPLFAQGKLRARHRNAQLEQEKARLHFTQTLLNAGNEVYCQLNICQKTKEKARHLADVVHSMNEAYEATRELMNNGTNTYVEVLKAQEDLLTAQLTEVQNQYDGIQALINLYTALGGFQSEDGK